MCIAPGLSQSRSPEESNLRFVSNARQHNVKHEGPPALSAVPLDAPVGRKEDL